MLSPYHPSINTHLHTQEKSSRARRRSPLSPSSQSQPPQLSREQLQSRLYARLDQVHGCMGVYGVWVCVVMRHSICHRRCYCALDTNSSAMLDSKGVVLYVVPPGSTAHMFGLLCLVLHVWDDTHVCVHLTMTSIAITITNTLHHTPHHTHHI